MADAERGSRATASFHEKLFGLTVSQDNALGYREIDTGGEFSGGVWPAPPGERAFVQLFISVPGVEAHLERATKLGARVLVPASTLPDGSRMAILLDPAGMSFGICTLAVTSLDM